MYKKKDKTIDNSGSLKIMVIQALLTKDTDTFTKMDPYATIQTGQQTFKTKVIQGGGKTPKWDQEFEIDVKNIGDDIHVKVLDEDVTTSDLVSTKSLT